MLCHILSIQVCRSTCCMKCKHTIQKGTVVTIYSEYTEGGGTKGGYLVKRTVTHGVGECGAHKVGCGFALCSPSLIVASQWRGLHRGSPRFFQIWDELLIKKPSVTRCVSMFTQNRTEMSRVQTFTPTAASANGKLLGLIIDFLPAPTLIIRPSCPIGVVE